MTGWQLVVLIIFGMFFFVMAYGLHVTNLKDKRAHELAMRPALTIPEMFGGRSGQATKHPDD